MFESIFGKKSVSVISATEVKERLFNDKKFILLDVRTPEEYKEAHIPGSKLLPLNLLKHKINDIVPDKETKIAVYCLSGMRAGTASSQLTSMGYTKVSNMGGIGSWKYEIERGMHQ